MIPAHRSLLMFVGCRDVGKVDVVDLATGLVLRRVDAPGVTCVAQYWRQ